MNGAALTLSQVRYVNKAFWRNPASAFFTFAFPLMFLVIFTALLGHGTVRISPTKVVNTSTYYVAAMASFAVITACYTNIAINVSFQRDSGVLKRTNGTPLPSSIFLGARMVHALFVAVVLVAITAAFGRVLYGADIPTGVTLLRFLVMLLVGAASFCALGFAITAVIPNADASPASRLSRRLGPGTRSDGGHLVQRDAGRHPCVQRLGPGRDRDPDQHVTGLSHDPRQPAALRADDHDQRGGGQLQVADLGVPGRVQARHEDPGVPVGLQRAGQVDGAGHRHAGQRARGRLPGTRRDTGAAAARNDHPVRAERGRRTHHRAQVARVGDAVQGGDQRQLPGIGGPGEQVVGMRVVVGTHAERQALVQGAAGEPVEFGGAGLEHRHAPVGGELDGLADPLVVLRTGPDV